MRRRFFTIAGMLLLLATLTVGQEPAPGSRAPGEELRKANTRPIESAAPPEPFDDASVEKMASQCVNLETAAGAISIEVFPDAAPAAVRSFLNLAATGALDTTTFSRVVRDFVVQGGNLSTSEKWDARLAARMSRKLPDEPNLVKHERGIVSMARPEEPDSATTHFFILVNEAHHLDGRFTAFGRVRQGMEVVDRINQADLKGEQPVNPVRINRVVVVPCSQH
jgi:peptidyl-prolyl cis-trans isomerase B (cyclophilin B)